MAPPLTSPPSVPAYAISTSPTASRTDGPPGESPWSRPVGAASFPHDGQAGPGLRGTAWLAMSRSSAGPALGHQAAVGQDAADPFGEGAQFLVDAGDGRLVE